MNSKYILLSTAILLASCGGENKSALQSKKEELAKLKGEHVTLEAKIKTLESEIGKLDTTKRDEVRLKYVTVSPIAAGTFEHYVEVQGRVDAKNSVLVTPKSPGVITAVYIKEGSAVKAGSVMMKVDDSILRETIEETKNQLTLAETLFQKQKNLWDQKIGTEIQYIQAKNNLDAVQKRIATLNTQLSQSNVIAPISGVVDQVVSKIGEMASPGMGVARVVNLGVLKVIANVSDAYVASVRKGDQIIINFPDLNREYKAKVSFVSTTVDPLSRTFAIEADLPSAKDLKPNMMAQVKINDVNKGKAIVIDQNLIQNTENGNVVYVAVTEGNKKVARARTVKTGLNYGGKIEVVEGLSAGDLLITLGYQEVSDGQPLSY